MAVFLNQSGDNIFTGTDGVYDQVDYSGDLTDYTFVQNANGTVTVSHPTLGTDTLFNIEGFWFYGENNWYSLEQALDLAGPGGEAVIGGTDGDDILFGTDGNDFVNGLGGNDTLVGGSGNDVIRGGDGDDNIIGELEDLSDLSSGTVNDQLYGDDGNDFLSGQIGNDLLAGGNGNDVLDGGSNDDQLFGGNGNDRLLGDSGNDLLNGGSGDDILMGDSDSSTRATGDDSMTGGDGVDTFILNRMTTGSISNNDVITDFDVSEGDVIDISDFGINDFGQLQDLMVQDGTSVRINFEDGSTLELRETNINDLRGADFGLLTGSAQTYIFGTGGDDFLVGSDINNVFSPGEGNDTIRGNGGDYNQVDYDGALADYTITQNQDGTITVAHPTLGTDTLTDIDGFWFGGEGQWYSLADALANSSGPVDQPFIEGTDGNDVLIGSNINNVFFGGAGDDIIDGNGGDYNQADYEGSINDYAIFANGDGTYTIDHADGTDTLTDIDGFWFGGDAQWYSLQDAIDATANDFLV